MVEQLLGDGEEGEARPPKDEAPQEEQAPKEKASVPLAAADSVTPSEQDVAEAEAIVGSVCARVVASMKAAESEPEAPAGDSATVDISAGGPPMLDASKEAPKEEAAKLESKLEVEAP